MEPQSETVWLHAERAGLHCILFVNKLDRPGADPGRVLAQAREALSPHIVPLHAPIGREGSFCGVVDLLSRQALTWREDEPAAGPVPTAMAEEVEAARAALIDAICEADDALMPPPCATSPRAAAPLCCASCAASPCLRRPRRRSSRSGGWRGMWRSRRGTRINAENADGE